MLSLRCKGAVGWILVALPLWATASQPAAANADKANAHPVRPVQAAAETFSPYAQRAVPSRPLWGDTHLHTSNSLDARAFGVTLSAGDAFRFARGETVEATHGVQFKLSRPLDWLAVTDHSDGMGAMKEIIAGNPTLMQDPQLRAWNTGLNSDPETILASTMEVIEAFTGIAAEPMPDAAMDPTFVAGIWRDHVATADAFNEPGHFTAIIGYEWTSTESGNNLHRNVLYRDGGAIAGTVLPFTTETSFNPEALWRWMADYEDQTGGQVLALAHNGNVSNGLMFPVEVNPATGTPLTEDYAKTRARWEPLYEVTQIKGDGEAHPLLSTDDEFADYETWNRANLGPLLKENWMIQYEYAREALKNGLKLERELGTNPYRFGMVGSTDSHTGLATAQEDNFSGKHSGMEPRADRWRGVVGEFGPNRVLGWEMVSSGLAAVWATENTREGIFDAMERREVYATTGSRMTVRFFGGWEFSSDDGLRQIASEIGYAKGVSMGGELSAGPEGASPSFLVAAARDAYSGNLDRVQIVKGWLDADGETHERVYNVVWAGERSLDANGKLPPVGDTVDVTTATFANTIGSPELTTVWTDPDFDSTRPAFYYARVLEIPTPRWTAYDALRYGVRMGEEVPMTTQERAYTSPIWYTP